MSLLMALMLTVVALESLSMGKIRVAPREVLAILTGHGSSEQHAMLIRQMRLPRMTAAVFVGAALAAAGLLMQTVMRNPLAAPSVLGVTSGAHLGVAIALVFAPTAAEYWPTLAACAGAFVVAAIIGSMALGQTARMDRDFVVVGGTLISAVIGSTITGFLLINHMNGALSDWQVGALVKISWARISIALPLIIGGLVLAVLMIRRIEVLALGRIVAEGLGVPTQFYMLGAMGAVVLMAGGSIAIAGQVAYVGLIVPYIFSRQRLSDPVDRLIACLLGGAVLTTSADLLSRTIDLGRIIPMGVWTMAMGALFFFAMSVRSPAARNDER